MKKVIKKTAMYLAFCGLFVFASCSTEPISEAQNIEEIQERGPKLDTWEDQVDRLGKKMRRFHNFQVAQAQGYVVLAGPYVPNMGYHFLNPNKVNGEFNLLEPEILVYHPDENGNMIFGAAEYLVPVIDFGNPQPHPEGFIGNDDHWHLNPDAGGWTLHAWVGLENPDGVFAAYNPLVPFAPPTD